MGRSTPNSQGIYILCSQKYSPLLGSLGRGGSQRRGVEHFLGVRVLIFGKAVATRPSRRSCRRSCSADATRPSIVYGDGYQLRHIHPKPELAVSLYCTSKYAAIPSTLPSKGSAIFRLRNRQQYSMVCKAYNTI